MLRILKRKEGNIMTEAIISRREIIRNITGIIISALALVWIKGFIDAYDFIPGLVFWLAAEIIVIADAYCIYGMIRDIRFRREKEEEAALERRIDALREEYEVGSHRAA